jgi:hypothetical protein
MEKLRKKLKRNEPANFAAKSAQRIPGLLWHNDTGLSEHWRG